ncbi:hypothetical protein FDA94_08380 [Herbidospora galbida]|uniref:Beta-lactamase-related domain-containing protein n=1 Tax=Herbidospora galbida TaxID=2575442 RepID=A0A4V5V017_9ACTN|nr:serine hydrolase [Herbidospora galbida]TKK89883.1 hypothetical protein FDA94_08380 [Herbidospora galbida]
MAAYIRWDLTYDKFRQAYDNYSVVLGLRLVDLCGYEIAGQAHYAAIWERGSGPQQWTDHALPFDDYLTVYTERRAAGFRPVIVNGYNVGTKVYFATVWEKQERAGHPLWTSYHVVGLADLYTLVMEHRRNGYVPVDISGYRLGSGVFCSVVFEGWPGYDTRWDWIQPQVSAINYQNSFDGMDRERYRPVRAIGFSVPNSTYNRLDHFTSLWRRGVGRPFVARHNLDVGAFKSEVEHHEREKYRPVSVGGFSAGFGSAAVQRFCPIWEKREAGPVIEGLVETFMKYYDVPGLSLAISVDGRLVHAEGYGVADRASGEKVTAASRFRIASVAKPITSAAVMKLAETGRLSTIDLVFGNSGHLARFGTPTDPRVEDIIVLHLLRHSSGGWPYRPDDPMFGDPSLDHQQLITSVLANRPLNHDPGTRYAYSNFGYCVLGRVIEEVTGESYEAYVRREILAPCGIFDMELAGDTLADRRPGEVVYYDQNGGDPYGMAVTRMDAHGGWLARASDLLRFLARVDGSATPPDILDPDWIAYMTKPSGLAGSDGYACGWSVHGSRWGHGGDLPGSTSLLRRIGGFGVAALINTRYLKDASDPLDTNAGLSKLVEAIHDQVDHWPAGPPL